MAFSASRGELASWALGSSRGSEIRPLKYHPTASSRSSSHEETRRSQILVPTQSYHLCLTSRKQGKIPLKQSLVRNTALLECVELMCVVVLLVGSLAEPESLYYSQEWWQAIARQFTRLWQPVTNP